MAETKLLEAIFSIETFEEFRKHCQNILKLEDKEIIEKLLIKPNTEFTVEKIRSLYQRILDNVTESSFITAKHTYMCESLTNDADILANSKANKEAIQKYREAINEAEQIMNKATSIRLINITRLSIARVFHQIKDYDNAIMECKLVYIKIILGIEI